MTNSIALFVGWVLDMVFGDPEKLPHPIVYMGKWIAFGEQRLNKGRHRKAKGAVFAIVSIALTFAIAWAALHYSLSAFHLFSTAPAHFSLFTFHFSLTTVIVFFCLAGRTLRSEVRMVFEAVERSTEDGRRQVARIVGRDTSALSDQEIRTAALETLAENLSDGVIAPLFWFAVLGAPGMLAYKMVNTLDSMIGYHSERYKDFGCWAARIDDIANYIPARLTAFLMLIVAPLAPSGTHDAPADSPSSTSRYPFEKLRFILRYGPQHASPNSGWPEAALASILSCRFGGPHNYFGEYFYKPYIGDNDRMLTTHDMKRSIRICFFAECIAVALALALAFTIL